MKPSATRAASTTTELPAVPTRRVPVVRAPNRGHGRWGWAAMLAVLDAMVAMFLLGTALGALFPTDLAARGSAPRSAVPSPVVSDTATGGGVSVAADVPLGRLGGGRDGGTWPAAGVSTSTTGRAVVPDAAPTHGQTPHMGPVGGPASTTTVASVAPTLPPDPPEDTVQPSVPETSVPATEPQPTDTTPDTTPSTEVPDA